MAPLWHPLPGRRLVLRGLCGGHTARDYHKTFNFSRGTNFYLVVDDSVLSRKKWRLSALYVQTTKTIARTTASSNLYSPDIIPVHQHPMISNVSVVPQPPIPAAHGRDSKANPFQAFLNFTFRQNSGNSRCHGRSMCCLSS